MRHRPIRHLSGLCLTFVLLIIAPAAHAAKFELVSNATSSPSEPPPRLGMPIDELLRRAAGHPISVIVGLKLDREWIPDGFLNAFERANQHAAIADALENFRNRYADRENLEIRDLSPLPYVSLRADIDLLVRLNLDSAIASIELNGSGSGGLRQSAPIIGAPAAWNAGFVGTDQAIAILDSGVQTAHPFFGGRVVSEACYSLSFASHPRSTSLCPNGQPVDTSTGSGQNCSSTIYGCGHGTHVAGIAAGSSDANSIWGIAKGANIISILVEHAELDAADCNPDPAPCARYFNDDLVDGLKRVFNLSATYKIAAVNMSLQSTTFYTSRSLCTSQNPGLQQAVDLVRSAGIAVVGIAGNFANKGALVLPGCIQGVITVGATTKNDTVWSSSDSTNELDLLAPGDGNAANVGITSSVPINGFDWSRGTSMAAPHVAGALALLRQKSPNAAQAVLLQDLVTTGQPITDTNGVTKPRIDVWQALNADHTAPTAPAGLAIAATSASVALSWTPATDEHGVAYYSIQRRGALSAAFSQIDVATVPAYTDTAVTAQSTYQYQVLAVDTSGNVSLPSNRELTTTMSYADDALPPATVTLRAVHINELRTAVNSMRAFAGLSAATWTDTTLAGIPPKASHVLELRTRLNEAFSTIGLTAPSYTDTTLVANSTIIRAVHIVELRDYTK